MDQTIATSSASVVLFLISFISTGIIERSRELLRASADGMSALTSKALTDEEKEAAVQKASISLFFKTLIIAGCFTVTLGVAAIPIVLADKTGFVAYQDTIDLMATPRFILISSIAAIIGGWLVSLVLLKPKTKNAGSKYSSSDQIMHMLAFITPLQRVLFGIDNFFFRLLKKKQAVEKQIFITSLARGGTTACLNAFHSLDSVATNTYRDMPFITAPFLWNGFSKLIGRRVERHERAHGDGIEIDLESPEAFDEVYWMLWWSDHYKEDHINIWSEEDADSEKARKLQTAFDKVVAARGGDNRIYVSKNNNNFCRIGTLKNMFPQCVIIAPVRRPGPHAASLFRQHLNFKKQQSNDKFVRRYMEDIGHFEFGLAHRPVMYPGFDPNAYCTDSPDYWLAYWIAAFRHVQNNLDDVQIVLQDELRDAPDQTMKSILSRNRVPFGDETDFSTFFRNSPDETDESVFSPELLAEANAIYAVLFERGSSTRQLEQDHQHRRLDRHPATMS